MRYDRVVLRSTKDDDAGVWEAKSIQLVGNEPFEHESGSMFVSDHFGLLTTFEYRTEN